MHRKRRHKDQSNHTLWWVYTAQHSRQSRPSRHLSLLLVRGHKAINQGVMRLHVGSLTVLVVVRMEIIADLLMSKIWRLIRVQ